MSEEKLNSIQELIERKILLAEVNGGLTSSDKHFINLWNYTIYLQQENKQLKDNWNKLKEYINKYIKYDKNGRKISKYLNAAIIMNKINKLEQGNNDNESI